MQLLLRIPPTKFFFFQTSPAFFPPFFEYHVVFQHQSEDYIGPDEIIYIIQVFLL